VSASSFDLNFAPLRADRPAFGRVALVPWDSETFGFGIADLDIDIAQAPPAAGDLARTLERWTHERGVRLVGASVPTTALSYIDTLQNAGFHYLDTTLRITYSGIQDVTLPHSELTLRPFVSSDVPAVLAIAGSAFSHGRYHADPKISNERANQRYQDWVNRVLTSGGVQELHVLVAGDQVRAFSVIQIVGPVGHLHLVGVLPGSRGLQVTLATLRLFQIRGAAIVHSKISASNIVALNSHAQLGAQFHAPAALLHWHSKRS
jgi:hypothetical protein